MNIAQKVIKNLMIVLALSLIFGMIAGVIDGLSHLVNDGRKDNATTMKDIENSEDVAILNIDCKATNINICGLSME